MPFVPIGQVKTEQERRASETSAPEPVDLRITGMHCAACVTTVEQALGSVPGVAAANVNLATERAHVRLAGPVAVEELTSAVRAAGYDAHTVSSALPDDAEQRERAAALADLRRRFLIAALLSIPVVVLGNFGML